MKSNPIEIVILGGGYVGVLAYQSMIKKIRSKVQSGEVRITLVCPLADHTFHGWTSETLTGVIQSKNQLSPLSEVMPMAEQVFAQAESIDTDAQIISVRLENGDIKNLRYDHLLIGYGSFDSEKIEGLREYGYQVKARESFHVTKSRIYKLVQQAANSTETQARELLTFTLAGGGFTGVELAANITEYVQVLKNAHPSLKRIEPSVTLVHSGSELLSQLPEHCGRLVNYTEKVLEQFNIKVIKNRKIVRVTSEGAYLDNATFVPASMVISTVGQSRVKLGGTEEWLRDTAGRLHTNVFLQVIGFDNIWGGGDACHVLRHKKDIPCPSNALWAIKHGEAAGVNIALSVLKKEPKPFTFRGLGEAASLGMGKGIGELYGLQFTGLTAWTLRWFFFHYFMPSKRVMLRSMGDWMYLLFTGKRKGVENLKSQFEGTSQESSGVLIPASDIAPL